MKQFLCKFSQIALLSFLNINTIAVAVAGGNGAGNGGFARVCRKQNKIVSADFFDLTYGKLEHQWQMPALQETDAATIARNWVEKIYLANETHFNGLLASIERVIASNVKIERNFELIPPSAYLGNVRELPQQLDTICTFEPLGLFKDEGTLLVNPVFWEAIGNGGGLFEPRFNIAAFYVHEAIGDVLRNKLLANQKPSEPLSDEQRKTISRDTVNLTAMTVYLSQEKNFDEAINEYLTTRKIANEKTVSEVIISRSFVFEFTSLAKVQRDPDFHRGFWKQGVEKMIPSIKQRSPLVIFKCPNEITTNERKFLYEQNCRLHFTHKGKIERFTMNLVGWESSSYQALIDPLVLTFDEFKKNAAPEFYERSLFVDPTLKGVVSFYSNSKQDGLYQYKGLPLEREHRVVTTKGRFFNGFIPPYVNGTDFGYRETVRLLDLASTTVEVVVALPKSAQKTVERREEINSASFPFNDLFEDAEAYKKNIQTDEKTSAKMAFLDWQEKCYAWLKVKYKEGAIFAECVANGNKPEQLGKKLFSYSAEFTRRTVQISSVGRAVFPE